ncbi:MAG: hypothetical protein HY812_04310 [Planctomycetes bacterium]|nr:hypothetical protein [Planctomycetota bacterium]
MTELEPFPVHDPDVSHVIIEAFGGDNNLSSFVREDLEEMAAGNRGSFSVLALTDFADEQACVIELSPRSGMRVLEKWGEIDTGDPETLIRFFARALVSHRPEALRALGFWDHGSGVFDEQDPDETVVARGLARVPRQRRSRSLPARRLFLAGRRAMLHDDTNGGVLTNLEARNVLDVAFQRAGRQDKVELIFSDTCLNGMIEVLAELQDFARVVVASEDLEPGDGYDYHEWLARMSAAPPQEAEAWAAQAVEAFRAGYQHRPEEHPCTLGAFRTEQEVTRAFAELVRCARGLGRAGFAMLDGARRAAQSFADHDTYDLRDFLERVKIAAGAAQPALRDAAGAGVRAFDAARVASVALGESVSRSHGLAFWFPSSRHALEQDRSTYSRLLFNRATQWVDYLEGARAGS